MRCRVLLLAPLLVIQAVAALASDENPVSSIVIPSAPVSATAAVSPSEKDCDGYPAGTLRYKDGTLQICRP